MNLPFHIFIVPYIVFFIVLPKLTDCNYDDSLLKKISFDLRITGLRSRLSKPYHSHSRDFSDNYRVLWYDPSRVITNIAWLYRCLGLCAPSEKQPAVQIEAAQPLPRPACWPCIESQVLESRTEFIDIPRPWNCSRLVGREIWKKRLPEQCKTSPRSIKVRRSRSS